ncbi:integrase core domain-containing protein [Nonomuraea jabiensis]|uniref:integrase core domain-containing protein n=1 Tax=Nonomuraea jabiensis TaxID=882448 RepID=UPI0036D188F1
MEIKNDSSMVRSRSTGCHDRSSASASSSRHGRRPGTDRGSEYTAARYQELCRRLGAVQSMGRVGCALDNAAAEAFNSTLKVEYVRRHRFRARAEAHLKIATWIADFYNTTRRHSVNEGLPPITFERHMIEKRHASSALLRTAAA